MSQQNSFPSDQASESSVQEHMEIHDHAVSGLIEEAAPSVKSGPMEPPPPPCYVVAASNRFGEDTLRLPNFCTGRGTVKHKTDISRCNDDTGGNSSLLVPHQLRQVNKNAYEPELISIGPYHRDKQHLKEMEVYKESILDFVIPKSCREALEKYVDENMDRARECYPSDANLDTKMILRDGCFVVILLCDMAADIHPIRRVWVKNALYRDLLLLENQLPFFVLEDLYRCFVMNGLYQPEDGKDDFASLALPVLSNFVPGPKKWVDNYERNPTHNINNLLSLVHNNWSPSSQGINCHKKYLEKKETEMEGEESTEEEGGEDKWKFTLCAVEKAKRKNIIQLEEDGRLTESAVHNSLNWKFTFCRKEKKKLRKGLVEWQSIRAATELEEAGIKFKKCTHGSNVKSLFDISFKGATMEIPTFVIDDSTERLFRNLIAFELNKEGSTYVIDYVTLMDNLINSAKDVQLLRFNGVVENMLGDDVAVAQMINKLRDHVTLCGDTFYYEETFVGLKKHCARRWNMRKAKLRRDYFNSPWALISFLAALLIILLTIGGFITGVLQVTAAK